MAQPQCHLTDVASGLKDQKSARMAKGMRRETLCQETWASLCCDLEMLVQDILETRARECVTLGVEEDLCRGAGRPRRQPGTHRRRCLPPQGQRTFPATFAEDINAG